MAQNNDKSLRIEPEIESELFALLNTILNLYEKYQNGVIKENFFLKTIKNSTNDLLKFNFSLNDKKIILSKLLKKMDLTQVYYQAIDIINEVSSLDLSNEGLDNKNREGSQFAQKMRTSVLELPGITLEITSSFITLMDAIKLREFKEIELINKLFDDLKKNLEKFPGMEEIHTNIDKINKRVIYNSTTLLENRRFSERIVDDIYQVFKEFQNKLNLKNQVK
ncbi:MAG: hypothetical protein ACFE8L_00395 [Candidatus Hodarchaeota archaeon]